MGINSIKNVINVSVSELGAGLGEFNTSNLAAMTSEPNADSFGSKGYKVYLESSEVAVDFGSDSVVAKQASSIFSQSKNILTGGGVLVVCPLKAPTQVLTFVGVPDSGDFKISFAGTETSVINWDVLSKPKEAQAIIREIVGLENVVCSSNEVAQTLTLEFQGESTQRPTVTIVDNTVVDDATDPVTITPTQGIEKESFLEAVMRAEQLVQFFGVISAEILSDIEITETSNYIQSVRKMFFPASNVIASIEPLTGIFGKIQELGNDQTRCLYYGGTELDACLFSSAYAGRALSTNFNANASTQTMHLKDLSGIAADLTIGQTQIQTCKDTGVDLYISIQGVAKVFTSGGNSFFDRIYNKLWFIGKLSINAFNVLAQTSTKIPQTDEGVAILTNAYRNACEIAIVNSYIARGEWNSPDTFGNLEDFKANIRERGYYIYSTPLALQSAVAREDREAPIAQIAIKEAGAIHSADIIININA